MFNTIVNQYNKINKFLIELQEHRLERNRKYFLVQNLPQSDREFIFKCFETPSETNKIVALAIRNAIAKLGNIDSKFIRAKASFDDLDLLKFWKSCGDAGFDSLLFVEAIARELNLKFTD